MSFLILKTDNGPHPAHKWVEACAILAAPIYEETPPADRHEIAKLRHKIHDAVLAHHEDAKASAHLLDEDAIKSRGFDIVNAICSSARDTKWDNHFGSYEVVTALHDMVCRNLRTMAREELAYRDIAA